MHCRSRFAAAATAAFLVLVAVSQAVLAGPKDAAAKKADKEAMDNDFLTANFAQAEKKLNEAVKTCGDSACTPKLKAQILIHLGIVQVNQSKAADAEKSFLDALKIDAAVAPESDYESPEVKKAFAAAKGKGSGAPAASSAPAPTTAPTAPATPDQGGELTHTPVTEQMMETPVPLYVEVPEGLKVSKVIVMYRAFGSEEWKKLELKALGNGFGGMVPCEDVRTTGDLRYYVKAVDAGGDPVAEYGNKNKPVVTKIKHQLEADPPHLPNQAPPAKCRLGGDCPPDFPGCPKAEKCGPGGWGATCSTNKDCQCAYHCKVDSGKEEGTCEEGRTGDDGGEEPANAPFKRNWVGLTVSPDFAFISGDDVCGRDSQQNKGYACFRNDDTQYHGVPMVNRGNAIAGGLAPSTIRALVSFDRALSKHIALGLRAGWAFNGGPQPDGGNPFLPFHGELRLSYWFGKNPFAQVGFRPFLFLGAGMGQVDSKVPVTVYEQENCGSFAGGLCEVKSGDTVVQTNPQKQDVSAWHKAGQQFVSVGGGVMYALTPRGGIVGAVKYMQMFPTMGMIISPEVGYVFGF